MKKFLFLALVAMSLTLIGCGNPNVSGGGSYNEPTTTGYIQFLNQSDDSYYVDVAGFQPFTLGGSRSVTYEYEAGTYHITVTQKNGYILYPTVLEYTAAVQIGKTTIVTWD